MLSRFYAQTSCVIKIIRLPWLSLEPFKFLLHSHTRNTASLIRPIFYPFDSFPSCDTQPVSHSPPDKWSWRWWIITEITVFWFNSWPPGDGGSARQTEGPGCGPVGDLCPWVFPHRSSSTHGNLDKARCVSS